MTSGIESTILRKGEEMPKKPVFKDYPNYLVVYQYNGVTYTQECVGARIAIDTYRQLRAIYGNSCRLAKVVLSYGEEV